MKKTKICPAKGMGGKLGAMMYGLFIGIDDYPFPLKPLQACVRDVCSIGNWLKQRLGEQIAVQYLLNQAATRSAVIQGFRSHLGRAKKGDVVLFYFAGHGSREASAIEFQGEGWSPEGRDESLVLYDSRLPGNYDLADKELAWLISEIVRPGIRCVLIFDCCHSGGMTRGEEKGLPPGALARHLPARRFDGARELSTYLEGQYHQMYLEKKLALPRPSHVVFSACRPWQLAFELNGKGVFSAALLEVFREVGLHPTCLALHRYLQEKMAFSLRACDLQQSPQLDALGGDTVLTDFLGRREKQEFGGSHLLRLRGEYWLDRGALDGIGSSSNLEGLLICGREQVKVQAPILNLEPCQCQIELPLELDDPSLGRILFVRDERSDSENRSQEFFRNRWKRGLDLKGGGLSTSEVDLGTQVLGTESPFLKLSPAQIVLMGREEKIPLRVLARNRSLSPLYLTLIYFGADCRIHPFSPVQVPAESGFQILYGGLPQEYFFLSQDQLQTVVRIRLLISEHYPSVGRMAQTPHLYRNNLRHPGKQLIRVYSGSPSMGQHAFKDLKITLTRAPTSAANPPMPPAIPET